MWDKKKEGGAVGVVADGEVKDDYETADHDQLMQTVAQELHDALKTGDIESIAAALEAAITIIISKQGGE